MTHSLSTRPKNKTLTYFHTRVPATIFITDKRWEKPKCLSVDECVNKTWHIQMMDQWASEGNSVINYSMEKQWGIIHVKWNKPTTKRQIRYDSACKSNMYRQKKMVRAEEGGGVEMDSYFNGKFQFCKIKKPCIWLHSKSNILERTNSLSLLHHTSSPKSSSSGKLEKGL